MSPETPIRGDGDDVGHACDDPAQPIRPSQKESCPRAEEVSGKILKRLPLQVVQQQLAHGTHDEEEHCADNEVGHHDARTGSADGFAGAHKQAGTYGAANGNKLDVPIAEASPEVLLFSGGMLILHGHGEHCVPPKGLRMVNNLMFHIVDALWPFLDDVG